MGKGQRHSKNAGVMGSESLSYAERRSLGFGTVKERFGKVGALEQMRPMQSRLVAAFANLMCRHARPGMGAWRFHASCKGIA